MPEGLGNHKIFAQNLTHYIKSNNMDRSKICHDLNIPATTLSDWLNAKKYPRIDNLEKLANYFGIKKSDLTEERNYNDNILDDKIQVLYNKTKDILSDSDRDIIEHIMKRTIEDYEKKKNGG